MFTLLLIIIFFTMVLPLLMFKYRNTTFVRFLVTAVILPFVTKLALKIFKKK